MTSESSFLKLQLPGLQLEKPGLNEVESVPREWREGLGRSPGGKVRFPSPPVPPHRAGEAATTTTTPSPGRVTVTNTTRQTPSPRQQQQQQQKRVGYNVGKSKPATLQRTGSPKKVQVAKVVATGKPAFCRSPSPVKKLPPPPQKEPQPQPQPQPQPDPALQAKLAASQTTVKRLSEDLNTSTENCLSFQADLQSADSTIATLRGERDELEEALRQQAERIQSLQDDLRAAQASADSGSTSPRVMWQQSLNDKGAMLQEWEEALQEKQLLMEDRENHLREMESGLRAKDKSMRDICTREALLAQREKQLENLNHKELELRHQADELQRRSVEVSKAESSLHEEQQRLSLDWKELGQLKEIVRKNPALRHYEVNQQEVEFKKVMKEREDSLHEKSMELAAWEKRLSASAACPVPALGPTPTPTKVRRSVSRDVTRQQVASHSPAASDGIRLHVIQRTPTGTQKLQSFLNHAYEEDFSTPRTFSPSPSQARTPSWSLTK